MHTHPPRAPEWARCAHCQRSIWHPLWIRRDHDDYLAMCPACAHQVDQDLTVDNAIVSAIIICGLHLGRLHYAARGAQ